MRAGVFLFALILARSAQGQPVVWYPFNGNLTPNAGPTPVAVGPGVSFGPDRFGSPNSALSLTGGAFPSYLDLATDDDYPSRTVSFWFNASVILNLLGMIYESDVPLTQNGQTQFGVINNTMDYLVGNNHVSAAIVPGRWYFAAIVKSATDVKFYLNCTLVGTGTNMSNGHSVNPNDGTWML